MPVVGLEVEVFDGGIEDGHPRGIRMLIAHLEGRFLGFRGDQGVVDLEAACALLPGAFRWGGAEEVEGPDCMGEYTGGRLLIWAERAKECQDVVKRECGGETAVNGCHGLSSGAEPLVFVEAALGLQIIEAVLEGIKCVVKVV